MTKLERLIIDLKKFPGYGITDTGVSISGNLIKELVEALEEINTSPVLTLGEDRVQIVTNSEEELIQYLAQHHRFVLSNYEDQTAAMADGLEEGDLYHTDGQVMIVF